MQSKIIGYKAVGGYGIDTLNPAVNKAILEGWQPFGPIALSTNGACIQAMVQYDVPDPKELYTLRCATCPS